MENTKERDEKVTEFLKSLYEKATDADFSPDETAYKPEMDKLFTTDVWGYREILLVVVAGMHLSPAYRASRELYACKPRAIYEGPVKEFLIEKELPHRKSGPLNIAKAAEGLNAAWAAHRRPSDAAKAVVSLVKFLESAKNKANAVENVGVSLLRRLIGQAEERAALAVDLDPSEDAAFLLSLCSALITRAPDAGNTPQKIVALLLKCYHAAFGTGVDVTGDERASVTSTTSKKPGDINEERGGEIYKVYEVTVKRFDLARIRDSFDCISHYNEAAHTDIREVTVLCRKEDCPAEAEKSGLYAYLGRYDHFGVIYSFFDIFEWLALTLHHVTAAGRKAFHGQLNGYINETNTAESVKLLWKELHP